MKHEAAKEKLAKLQINMSRTALEELDELQKKINASTRTEVVKSSLKLFKFMTDEKAGGSKIIIKDKSGKEREIVF